MTANDEIGAPNFGDIFICGFVIFGWGCRCSSRYSSSFAMANNLHRRTFEKMPSTFSLSEKLEL